MQLFSIYNKFLKPFLSRSSVSFPCSCAPPISDELRTCDCRISKMVFFDLNIPYRDDATSSATKSSGRDKKSLRLKTVVKLLELGYIGVAYDKSIKGVMSDKDRCTIAPYPISSLLKASPNLAESVKFHREILGVSISDPFRQYRRLTVVVDSVIQCSVLNSGNPVLKTYDLVAVRPLNQVALDQACKTAEV